MDPFLWLRKSKAHPRSGCTRISQADHSLETINQSRYPAIADRKATVRLRPAIRSRFQFDRMDSNTVLSYLFQTKSLFRSQTGSEQTSKKANLSWPLYGLTYETLLTFSNAHPPDY